MSEVKAYKHCFYDNFTKNIWIKYAGDDQYTKVPYLKDYWVKDPTGKSEIKDIYGIPMIRKTKYDKETIESLKETGISIAESDLKEEVKYLHSVYDKVQLVPNINEWNVCLFDIEIAVESEFPKAEEAKYPINLITCYSSKTKQTYTFGTEEYNGKSEEVTNYFFYKTEMEMMKGWLKWFNQQNFDVWSGWNSELFDVPYIINRIKNLREQKGLKTELERALSPAGKLPESYDIFDPTGKTKLGSSYKIKGLVHHDYMKLYQMFGTQEPQPSYSLQAITTNELGEGKLEYEGSINTIYKTDWNRFVEYNVQDVNLLVKLEDKKKIFPLIIEYAYDCVCTIDKVFNKVPTTTGYILKFLHNNNKVLNDKKKDAYDWWKHEKYYIVKDKDGNDYYQNCNWEKGEFTFKDFGVKAGYCYDIPGRYDNCMSFDITSSYPHHMMQFNISPEVKVIKPTKEQIESGEVIPSDINGVGFRRTEDAILPSVVKQVFGERKYYKKLKKEAKKAGDKDAYMRYDNIQYSKKIIINSCYGVCLQSGFHLFDIDCARSITRCARVTLRDWLKQNVDKYYETKYFLNDVQKEFSKINIEVEPNVYKTYYFNDKITVQRNNEVIEILAKDFNKETDLLGIDEN